MIPTFCHRFNLSSLIISIGCVLFSDSVLYYSIDSFIIYYINAHVTTNQSLNCKDCNSTCLKNSPIIIIIIILTVTGVPARQRRHLHTGSSPRVSQNWPRNPSSHTRRHYSWCASPGRCRSYSSGLSLLHFHGRIIACSGHWVSSGQTCRQCGFLSKCASWNTRWHPSHGTSTASRRAPTGAASICHHFHHTWGCRWALGAGRPASKRSCWGTEDSRTGNIARWGISGSSSKHCDRESDS